MIADASALPVGDWLPPSIAPLLLAIVAVAAVGTLTLFVVGLIGYARRSTFRYRVLTIVLGALVVRSIVGAGTAFGLVPMVVHHLVGHGADLLVAWLLLYLLYCERGPAVRETDIDAATELETSETSEPYSYSDDDPKPAMGSDGGRDYSPTEIFAIKFVLADVIIIAALVLAGPWVAVAITGLFVLSFLLLWYLIQAEPFADDEPTGEREVASEDAGVDPVTKLQERYAAGELSDAEFEAKLERLIEANERAESAGIDTEELELELEFERSGPE